MITSNQGTETGRADTFFIAGTDTSVGKTLICSLLLGFLLEKGFKTNYQKWVSTGSHEPEDLLYCFRNNQLVPEDAELDYLNPYRFNLAASPHLAAEVEGKSINPSLIKTSLGQAAESKEIILVEGVGGMMVPLTRNLLLIDLVAELKLPVVLVARSGLGTINHSLLTIESLKKRGITLLGMVFSDEDYYEAEDLLVNDNMKTIKEMTGVNILGRLPRSDSYQRARELFRPVGEKLLTRHSS